MTTISSKNQTPMISFVVCIFSMYEKEQLGTEMFQRNLIWKEPTNNWLWIKWKEAKRVERLLVQPQLFKYWSKHIDLPSEFNETRNTANLIVQESSNLSEFHIQYVAMRNVNVFTSTFNQRSTKVILLQMLIYSQHLKIGLFFIKERTTQNSLSCL